jgi:hypothetical protein
MVAILCVLPLCKRKHFEWVLNDKYDKICLVALAYVTNIYRTDTVLLYLVVSVGSLDRHVLQL